MKVRQAQLEDEGYWRIILKVEETSNTGKVYHWEKQFYLIVMEAPGTDDKAIGPVNSRPLGDYLTRESLYREIDNEGRPQPYLYELDSEGQLTIGWTA